MSVFGRNERATDFDRAATCTTLDNAYGQGQLDTAEHGNRVAAAMKAKTLGELDQLTVDLQRSAPTPGYSQPMSSYAEPSATYAQPSYAPPSYAQSSPLMRSGRPSGIGLAVVGVIVAVVVGLGGLFVFSSVGSSGSSSGGSFFGGADPIVVNKIDLMTADGLHKLIQNAKDRFGDTTFDEVVIYPEYAIFTKSVPNEPNRAVRYTWRGGFDNGSPTPRTGQDVPVDLSQLNVEAALGLMAGAPQSLNVRDVTSRYFIIGGPFAPLSVYVSNAYSETGYLSAGLDGTVQSVYPNAPR
ncbi:DUF1707 domain-containing protein [Smaragdicoccus niigatensis]|uniref:DUF1707 SHOCT-like domain-containing protein n=1 Tax=Smaragdicoccus niigatensis TaxID=359359 RepID=UPI00037BA0FB|nr:DUF1707 domain-containing protein [Smaragdicoccus niigatensis]